MTEIFNGTAQEVLSQVQTINPGFRLREAEAPARFRSDDDGGGDDTGPTHCSGFPEALVSDILMGMQYLRGLSGTPTNGPGPGNCGRVSCSDAAGIWWCNDVSPILFSFSFAARPGLSSSSSSSGFRMFADSGPGSPYGQNTAPKTLRSWDEIADSAGRIYDTCNPSHMDWVMNGQDFNPGYWNTIVRGREDC